MANDLNQNIKIDIGYKGQQSVLSTDYVKNLFEEVRQSTPTLDTNDIYADILPYNDPFGAISSGLVLDYTDSNKLTFIKDPTVGGIINGYYVSGNIGNWIQHHKYGDLYAPRFYSSGTLIPAGQFWNKALFNYKAGYLTTQCDFGYSEPFEVDGYVYNGRLLTDVIEQVDSLTLSGDVTQQDLLNLSGYLQNEIDNINTTNNIIGVSGITTITSGNTVFIGIDQSYSKIKIGEISGELFNGHPRTYNIIFDMPFQTNFYTPTVSSEDNRGWTINNKNISGFIINSNSSKAIDGFVYWSAISV